MLPLAHLKVVDLTQALAGAYCAAMLADMGADGEENGIIAL